MYIVRDIFHLKFGHYRPVKALLDEAASKNMFKKFPMERTLTDFTGKSYRLIFEAGFESLEAYEKSMIEEMSHPDWRGWYEKFCEHIESSEREILKLIV